MEEQERWSLGRYRSDLRSVTGSSATAYGYTLTVCSGVTLDPAQNCPSPIHTRVGLDPDQ